MTNVVWTDNYGGGGRRPLSKYPESPIKPYTLSYIQTTFYNMVGQVFPPKLESSALPNMDVETRFRIAVKQQAVEDGLN